MRFCVKIHQQNLGYLVTKTTLKMVSTIKNLAIITA